MFEALVDFDVNLTRVPNTNTWYIANIQIKTAHELSVERCELSVLVKYKKPAYIFKRDVMFAVK